MKRHTNNLKCESFIALTDQSELFIKTVSKFISKGDNIGDKLKRVNTDFKAFGCMDSFWSWASNVKMEKEFYFGFHLQPKWVENVIDEFNKEFKNFSIEIVWKKDLNIIKGNDWDGSHFLFTDNFEEGIYLEAGSYIYKLNEHIKLEPKTKRKILYIFHHFLRSCSIAERIFDLSSSPPRGSYIDYVLNMNNKVRGGRALTDYFVSRYDFLSLDNEDVLKSFTDLVYSGCIKQSDILFIAGKINQHGKKYFEKIPWETGCMPNFCKIPYGLFLTDSGSVYIRKKPDGLVINNNYIFTNRNEFYNTSIQVNFKTDSVKMNSPHHRYFESSIKNYSLFPLIEIFNRYPELDYKVIPKLVNLVNEQQKVDFKIPPKESFLME